MEGRRRTRRFLSGEETDRPPFVPLATSLTARLAQVEEAELFSDPNLLMQSYVQAAAVCRFECVLLRPPQAAIAEALRGSDPTGHQTITVLREGITRLRALLQDRVALGVLLPGPWWLAGTLDRGQGRAELDGATASLLQTAQSLEPPLLDVIGILEPDPLPPETVSDLGSSLSTLWNSMRYYSVPSLFLAAEAGPTVGSVGAAAVATWRGGTAEEIIAAGAQRAGVPVDVGNAPPLPQLPAAGFWLTEGEIPADVEVAHLQELAVAVAAQR